MTKETGQQKRSRIVKIKCRGCMSNSEYKKKILDILSTPLSTPDAPLNEEGVKILLRSKIEQL